MVRTASVIKRTDKIRSASVVTPTPSKENESPLSLKIKGRIIKPRDQSVIVIINNMGRALIHQALPVRISQTESVKSVSAASSWFEVPNSVQKIFHAGMSCPELSVACIVTQKKGISKLSQVAWKLPQKPFQPARSWRI